METTRCGKEYVEEIKQLELPPGFRFYPSDEELVSHYLAPKVFDPSFVCLPIGEADLNKCEPWDLPWRAKMGEKEWYFFSLKDRKYPTGLRTNRATESGYWKATGKDKEIYKMKTLVGMKKTLVFYRGRAPKGEKTNWVMHEFRLDGKYAAQNLPKSAKNEWVISRVFEKCAGGKKIHIGNQAGNGQSNSEHLPPLMDSSPYTSRQSGTEGDGSSHVTCFSNPTVTQHQNITKDELVVDSYFPPPPLPPLPPPSSSFAETPLLDYTTYGTQFVPSFMLETRRWNNSQSQIQTQTQNGHLQFHGGGMIQQDVDHSSTISGNNVADFDSIWSYFMQ